MTRNKVWLTGVATPVMIAVLLLLVGLPSVTASDQPAAANAEVKIDNFSFGPQTLTVPVGATVMWTNHDDIPHTVVSRRGVQVQGAGYRREVFLHIYQGGYVFLLLLGPPENDGQGRGAMRPQLLNGIATEADSHSSQPHLLPQRYCSPAL